MGRRSQAFSRTALPPHCPARCLPGARRELAAFALWATLTQALRRSWDEFIKSPCLKGTKRSLSPAIRKFLVLSPKREKHWFSGGGHRLVSVIFSYKEMAPSDVWEAVLPPQRTAVLQSKRKIAFEEEALKKKCHIN